MVLRTRSRALLALCATVALAAGCPKKPPALPDEDGAVGRAGGVDEPLQVVSILPDAIPANRPVPARILGAGFQQGASVRIGDGLVPGVTFVDENTLTLTVPGLPDGVYDVTVQNPDARERTLYAGLRVGSGMSGSDACRNLVVYFDLDQAGLSDAARATLDANTACWTASLARLRVEGHADERGTTDYNVALALRRADTVRMYLVNRGVAPASLIAVSWGEERPADPGHDESAWGKNRRVELHLEQ